MSNFVLYHNNCTDGLAAAYCAWKTLPKETTFIPVNYSQTFPKLDLTPEDKVYILDFCYPFEVLQNSIPRGCHVVVIDHHKTAFEEFEKIVNYDGWVGRGIFDLNRSGAMLAWEWFMKGAEPPEIIKHVQDRDLWRFELPATSDVIAGLRAFKDSHKFEVFDTLVYDDEGSFNTEMVKKLSSIGSVLNEKNAKD